MSSEINAAPVPPAEVKSTPELLSQAQAFTAFDARILIGGNALDATSKIDLTADDIKKQVFDQKQQIQTDQTIENLSNRERSAYWKKRTQEAPELNESGAQKKAWISEVARIINDPSSEKRKAILATYHIGQEDKKIDFAHFSEAEAEKLYDHYFGRKFPEGLTANRVFMIDVAQNYLVLNEKKEITGLNVDKLNQDMEAVQLLAGMFGNEFSDEILARKINAEVRFADPKEQQALLQAALTEEAVGTEKLKRINHLQPREKELLEALQGKIPSKATSSQDVDKKVTPPTDETVLKYIRAVNDGTYRYLPYEEFVKKSTDPEVLADVVVDYAQKKGKNIDRKMLVQTLKQEQSELSSVLERNHLGDAQLKNILQTTLSNYEQFIQNTYHVDLPKINFDTIVVKPIWKATAAYLGREALAFVNPQYPVIFINFSQVFDTAKTIADLEHMPLTVNHVTRLLQEIKPHEFTHLIGGLGYWVYGKPVSGKDNKLHIQSSTVGKVGIEYTKAKIENNEVVPARERGRGLMEAVTVELTDRWAKSQSARLDLPAYPAERTVLNSLCDYMANSLHITKDQAFQKFVNAYFKPHGLIDLTYGLAGSDVTVNEKGVITDRKGNVSRPHMLGTVYALMEYESQGKQAPITSYDLTLAYIQNKLTDEQKRTIGALLSQKLKNNPDFDSIQLSRSTIQKIAAELKITLS